MQCSRFDYAPPFQTRNRGVLYIIFKYIDNILKHNLSDILHEKHGIGRLGTSQIYFKILCKKHPSVEIRKMNVVGHLWNCDQISLIIVEKTLTVE